jgi:hypothetical protein
MLSSSEHECHKTRSQRLVGVSFTLGPLGRVVFQKLPEDRRGQDGRGSSITLSPWI